MNMTLTDETFKHILQPVFISSYNYDGKQYSFYVNCQTGKIHGTRPYSFWKIFLAVVAVLILIAVAVYLMDYFKA